MKLEDKEYEVNGIILYEIDGAIYREKGLE